MPVIIPVIEYDRWLSPLDPDPYDLLRPFPPEPLRMWPISTRVNKPENDDVEILEPVGVEQLLQQHSFMTATVGHW
jgi:putative SOS response-associated peptidase YedK